MEEFGMLEEDSTMPTHADFDTVFLSSLLAPPDSSLSLRETERMEESKIALGCDMSHLPLTPEQLGFEMGLTDKDSDESAAGKKSQRGGRKRLSADQVSCLENCFKVESKLGPHRKNQLAEELGLKPRQVAIWFQNRRARYKSKRMEKEYDQVAGQYGMIKAQYDKVINENKKLKAQMKCMKEQMSLMTNGLRNYETLMKAGLLNPQFMQPTKPELRQTYSYSDKFENVRKGGMVEQKMVQQQKMNSPASSVFESNSPVLVTINSQLAPADICYPMVESAEKMNTNFRQAERDYSVNQEAQNYQPNLLRLDDQNCFYSSQVDGSPVTPGDFGVDSAAYDPFWQSNITY